MKVRKTYQFDATDITAREASVDDMTAAFRLVGLVTIKSGMKVVDGAGGGLFKSVKFVLEGEPEDFEALEAWVESQEEQWYDFMWMAGALARTPSVIGGAVESFKNLAATCKNNINAMAAFAQTQGDTVQERAKRRKVKPRRIGPWTQHGTAPKPKPPAPEPPTNTVDPVIRTSTAYQTYELSDMTEGRGQWRPVNVYDTEQAAWDSVNELGGVMGRHPRDFDFGDWQGVDNWQQYKVKNGRPCDYDVREIIIRH